ncbi:MAG: hypothetical protein RI964_1239 [Pseudomonadota bacterium]|jgi:hypothetical protein
MQTQKKLLLIVHIGMGKTGSSSIQKTLAGASEALAQQQAMYLGLNFESCHYKKYEWQKAGGWPELFERNDTTFHTELKDVLLHAIKEGREKNFAKLIWSNESLFNAHHRIIPTLSEVQQSENIDVKIITYIRRHDSWAQSAYIQWGIKHKTYRGEIKSFREWINKGRLNYSSSANPWAKAFHNFEIINFDKAGNIVKSFFDIAELDYSHIYERRDNESPNLVALSLWAMFNDLSNEPVLPHALENLLKRAGLIDKEPRSIDIQTLLPNLQDLEYVRKISKEDRENINQLLAKCEQPLIETEHAKLKSTTIDHWQMHSALLMLLVDLNKQVNILKQQIKKLQS